MFVPKSLGDYTRPMDSWINNLSGELFWDVNRATVREDLHAKWLLERVLERGRWEDWILVRDNLGRERITALAPSLRLDPKSQNFLNIYCGP